MFPNTFEIISFKFTVFTIPFTHYPESPEQEDYARKKAIFNVSLWKELYKQIGKSPPSDFWIPLKNSANVDAPTAKAHESVIRKWYLEDIGLLPESILDDSSYDEQIHPESKTIRSSSPQNKPMSQQMVIPKISSLGQLTVPTMGTIEINDEDTLTIARSYLNVLEKKIKEKKSDPAEKCGIDVKGKNKWITLIQNASKA